MSDLSRHASLCDIEESRMRALADAAIEALGMNAYMTPERMTAHHAALGVVWTDPRTVADAPAADDEGGRA